MLTYIVLLGPPGVGKGTQSEVLASELDLPHISSGDIFRENIKNDTALGKLAQTFIKKGELVPDDVTIDMLRERFSQSDCKNGAILDGFPRTPAQADALEILLNGFGGQVNLVLFITAPVKALIERLAGRWTCLAHGHIFHECFNPPRKKGICDLDGSDLYQREDDKAETVLNRIEIYQNQTAPLIQYYKERGLLIKVNGIAAIDAVSMQVMSLLQRAWSSDQN
jgi:adenylate kinase